ncbi:Outer-membrane lipoprotein carrier protein [Candidatus Profftia tarda]|uniref:Outer-membrane lipoprotein carrier protein n=1 Tax=Candidatus Profftia tarda TaxID=1177216 RepID=A0A8E4F1Y0_9ENTR|nr:Outer-membrane lipoprotein carrier protein [Candidatus Profftia tarda]
MADANLQNRLNKINGFHASFIQKLITAEGIVLHRDEGDIWVKRPNLFNWHVIVPDESILISDGKALWFYTPLLEQVTVTWLDQAISSMPFILITNNNAKELSKYHVKQSGDFFYLTPKSQNDALKKLMINISPRGMIGSFSWVNQDGLISFYRLKNNCSAFNVSKFVFLLPEGVTVDDQRQ